VEQGYFEYVVMDIMSNQFYLSWHANYNDLEIVCNRGDVNDIVKDVSSGDSDNGVIMPHRGDTNCHKRCDSLDGLRPHFPLPPAGQSHS
jgi:hypothetical protein